LHLSFKAQRFGQPVRLLNRPRAESSRFARADPNPYLAIRSSFRRLSGRTCQLVIVPPQNYKLSMAQERSSHKPMPRTLGEEKKLNAREALSSNAGMSVFQKESVRTSNLAAMNSNLDR